MGRQSFILTIKLSNLDVLEIKSVRGKEVEIIIHVGASPIRSLKAILIYSTRSPVTKKKKAQPYQDSGPARNIPASVLSAIALGNEREEVARHGPL